MFKSKGFAIPIVIIFIGIFLSIPVLFWFYSKDKNDNQIMGSSITGSLSNGAGLVLEVNSKSGTWDLFYYLCESESECVSSVTAGKKQSTFHGGAVSGHKVVIEKTDDWDSYEFAKFYLRPSWGSMSTGFNVSSVGGLEGSYAKTLSEDGSNVETVLIPLESVEEVLENSAVFSDF